MSSSADITDLIDETGLTPAQKAELDALAALPDDQINTRDIPEQTDWIGAKRGLFFRPARGTMIP
jgi:hypothetical protein